MKTFDMLDNQLQPVDFIRLWKDAGWGDIPGDIVETALKNSYATFSVADEGRVIAMGRLLGDGAMAFFLKDFVVDTAYRGCGIGKALLKHMEDYIRAQLKPGWKGYFELVSAQGKEAFYEKCGFHLQANDGSGAAMSKWVE